MNLLLAFHKVVRAVLEQCSAVTLGHTQKASVLFWWNTVLSVLREKDSDCEFWICQCKKQTTSQMSDIFFRNTSAKFTHFVLLHTFTKAVSRSRLRAKIVFFIDGSFSLHCSMHQQQNTGNNQFAPSRLFDSRWKRIKLCLGSCPSFLSLQHRRLGQPIISFMCLSIRPGALSTQILDPPATCLTSWWRLSVPINFHLRFVLLNLVSSDRGNVEMGKANQKTQRLLFLTSDAQTTVRARRQPLGELRSWCSCLI